MKVIHSNFHNQRTPLSLLKEWSMLELVSLGSSVNHQGETMQTLAVLALVIGLIMLFRWLGPPVRRLPGEKKTSRHSPEADLPPPTDYPIGQQ
jgi:hypothetical protein